MEIMELNIKHFGKFLEHKVNFQPGVNIIYGGNETGKSTIHAFIRAMFFGIERGRGKAGKKESPAGHDLFSEQKGYVRIYRIHMILRVSPLKTPCERLRGSRYSF